MAKKKTASKKTVKKLVRNSDAKSASKSDAIRQHLQKHPADGPSAISEALAKRGIKVTPAFVSTVKSNDRRRTGGNSRQVGRAVSGGAQALDESTMRVIANAKKLVEEMGSVTAAKAALDEYGRFMQ